MKYIPYGRQSIDNNDVQAVIEVLQSDWLTTGPAIERFERGVADYCGAKYAVAVNSATAALHIACLAAGVGQGDKLWTSPNTFVASANCGLYCGATVDFVDIDPKTLNMSSETVEQKLGSKESCEKLPKVVIPVHFAGQSCDMEDMAGLAKKYGFTVIEDASHAIGGWYKNTPVGSCTYSDMTVFSFHPVKIVTTGEGGMVLTNQKNLYEKLLLYRSHGITRNPAYMTEEIHGPWYYQQIELGFNYRMTDIQAALGVSQVVRLDEFVRRRRQLADQYNELLADLPLDVPYRQEDTLSSWHLYVIQLRLEEIAKTRQQVFDSLRSAGIGVNVHYIPVHTQPYYQTMGFCQGDYPHAESYYAKAISLPMYYGLTDEEQVYVVNQLKKILSNEYR